MPICRSLLFACLLGAPRAQDLAIEVQPFPGTRTASKAVSIVEAADGRLWFGCLAELLCHDGERLASIALEDQTLRAPASNLRALVAQDGGVLLATAEGIWSAANGTKSLQLLPGTAPLNAFHLAPATGSGLWVVGQGGRLLLRGADGSSIPAADAVDGARLHGLIRHDGEAYAWSDAGLHRLGQADGKPIAATTPLPGVRVVASRGEQLLLVTGEGVHRRTGNGPLTQLLGGVDLSATTAATLGPNGCWILDAVAGLRCLGDEDGVLRRVRLFANGGELDAQDLTTIEIDRQGLLWVGTRNHVYRAQLLEGIESCVLADCSADDVVSAMAEHAGVMWLGTENGCLFRQDHATWRRVETPWQPATRKEHPAAVSIQCLHFAPTGQLFVGTRREGVWRLDGNWLALDRSQTEVRDLTTAGTSTLYVAANRSILAAPLAADGTAGAFTQQAVPNPGRPGTFASDAAGNLWLTAFRGGLLRRRPGDVCFEPAAEAWADDTVLHLATAIDGRSLWVVTMVGLWQLDVTSGERTLVQGTSRGTLRMAAGLHDGTLWLMHSTQIAHYTPATRTFRRLPAGQLAHPRGLALRSLCVRADGEVWFGARSGYTRLAADAHRGLDWPVRIARMSVAVGGKALAAPEPGRLDLEVRADAGLLDVRPVLIDRSTDETIPFEIVLQKHESETQHTCADGRFPDLEPGVYEASVVAVLPTGLTSTLRLGHIHVVPPPGTWPYWLIAAVVLTAGSTWQLRRQRRERSLRHRHVDLEAGRRLAEPAPETLMELAWLAVVAGEVTAHRVRSPHASVWMHRPETRERARLAAFGHPFPAAEERTIACCASGVEVSDRIYMLDRGHHKDVVVCATDGKGIEFEILLHDLAKVDAATVAEIERTANPLLAAVGKSRWIERLETDFVRKTATIEAETHDLKSPLTVLRIAAFELAEQADRTGCQELRRTADTVSTAVENVLQSVDQMVAHFRDAGELKLRQVDPAHLALKVARQLQPLAAAKDIQLVTFETLAVDRVTLDETWFARVVENVVGNAIKYSPPGSTVRMSCSTGEEFVLCVEDEGPGFGVVERESVFLPGMVGSAPATGGESKTGMGLWIARQALRAMGGRIWIDDRQGRGARVCVALPRTPRPASG